MNQMVSPLVGPTIAGILTAVTFVIGVVTVWLRSRRDTLVSQCDKLDDDFWATSQPARAWATLYERLDALRSDQALGRAHLLTVALSQTSVGLILAIGINAIATAGIPWKWTWRVWEEAPAWLELGAVVIVASAIAAVVCYEAIATTQRLRARVHATVVARLRDIRKELGLLGRVAPVRRLSKRRTAQTQRRLAALQLTAETIYRQAPPNRRTYVAGWLGCVYLIRATLSPVGRRRSEHEWQALKLLDPAGTPRGDPFLVLARACARSMHFDVAISSRLLLTAVEDLDRARLQSLESPIQIDDVQLFARIDEEVALASVLAPDDQSVYVAAAQAALARPRGQPWLHNPLDEFTESDPVGLALRKRTVQTRCRVFAEMGSALSAHYRMKREAGIAHASAPAEKGDDDYLTSIALADLVDDLRKSEDLIDMITAEQLEVSTRTAPLGPLSKGAIANLAEVIAEGKQRWYVKEERDQAERRRTFDEQLVEAKKRSEALAKQVPPPASTLTDRGQSDTSLPIGTHQPSGADD